MGSVGAEAPAAAGICMGGDGVWAIFDQNQLPPLLLPSSVFVAIAYQLAQFRVM